MAVFGGFALNRSHREIKYILWLSPAMERHKVAVFPPADSLHFIEPSSLICVKERQSEGGRKRFILYRYWNFSGKIPNDFSTRKYGIQLIVAFRSCRSTMVDHCWPTAESAYQIKASVCSACAWLYNWGSWFENKHGIALVFSLEQFQPYYVFISPQC